MWWQFWYWPMGRPGVSGSSSVQVDAEKEDWVVALQTASYASWNH